MTQRSMTAGKGLRVFFLGQLVLLAAGALALLPFVSARVCLGVGLAGDLLGLWGLGLALGAHRRYGYALAAGVVRVLLTLLGIFAAGHGGLETAVVLLLPVGGFLQVLCLCGPTARLLEEAGAAQALRGIPRVWQLCAADALVRLVCTLVPALLPVGFLIAVPFRMVADIVQVMTAAVVAVFAFQSSAALLR